MADIEFECPHCQHILVVDERGAGKQVPCPECDGTVTIPALEAETEEQPVAASIVTHATGKVSQANKIAFKCRWCGQSLEAEDDIAGHVIDCPYCNRLIKIPSPTGNRCIKIPSNEERLAVQDAYRRLHERSVAGDQPTFYPERHSDAYEVLAKLQHPQASTFELELDPKLREAERDLERVRTSREGVDIQGIASSAATFISNALKLVAFIVVSVIVVTFVVVNATDDTNSHAELAAATPSRPNQHPSVAAARSAQQEPSSAASVNAPVPENPPEQTEEVADIVVVDGRLGSPLEGFIRKFGQPKNLDKDIWGNVWADFEPSIAGIGLVHVIFDARSGRAEQIMYYGTILQPFDIPYAEILDANKQGSWWSYQSSTDGSTYWNRADGASAEMCKLIEPYIQRDVAVLFIRSIYYTLKQRAQETEARQSLRDSL